MFGVWLPGVHTERLQAKNVQVSTQQEFACINCRESSTNNAIPFKLPLHCALDCASLPFFGLVDFLASSAANSTIARIPLPSYILYATSTIRALPIFFRCILMVSSHLFPFFVSSHSSSSVFVFSRVVCSSSSSPFIHSVRPLCIISPHPRVIRISRVCLEWASFLCGMMMLVKKRILEIPTKSKAKSKPNSNQHRGKTNLHYPYTSDHK